MNFLHATRVLHRATLSRLAVIAVTLLGASAAQAQSSTQAVPEYSVKAGYLLLFARYVQWPESSFASADAPLIIAVVGRDPFGSVLDATLRDQHIGKHTVQVIRLSQQTFDISAHLVYIAEMSRRDAQRLLDMCQRRPILTVSESQGPLENGAIVRLTEEAGKIRFDVDWTAATRVNLKIESPMLVAARQVYGAPVEIRNGVRQ